MLIIFGYLILGLSIFGGYFLSGGHLATLFQPILFLMVVSGGIAVFIAANNAHTIRETLAALPTLLRPDCRASSTLVVLEKVLTHLSKGDHSAAQNAVKSENMVNTLTPTMRDYLADAAHMASLTGMTADEFTRMTEMGLQRRITESKHIGNALRNFGHITVAVGAMVCLLGFIHSGLFAAGAEYMMLLSYSMVGAFYGIFIGWGVIYPLGGAISAKHGLLHTQYHCINLALGTHLRGSAPAVAITAGRMALPPALQVDRAA